MATILFTVPPLTGHLNPALAVASALRVQGHRIVWAVHAAQIGERLPAQDTVMPLEVPGAFDGRGCVADVRGFESVRLFFEDYTMPMAQAVLAPLEAAVRAIKPDVMVVDHQMAAGALVARKLSLRWLTLVTTTASILAMPPVLEDWLAQQYAQLQRDYLPVAQQVQRPTFSPYGNIVFSVENLVGQAHERIEAPYVFVGPAQGQGRQNVDFPWQWLRDDKQHLLVTLGTVSRDRDTRFFEVVMAAVATMPDVQAVLVAPSSLAEQAPDNVLVRDYVPQLALLEKMHGVICHAGHNTVCETLAQGLPLIVAPIRDDQPIIARQVVDAGAGISLRYGKATVSMASTAIRRLLQEDALKNHAQRIAREFAAAGNSAENAAHYILALAAGQGTGSTPVQDSGTQVHDSSTQEQGSSQQECA